MNDDLDPERYFEAVVIGASAGGLHAIIQLLEDLPEDYPLPFVIVQHRGKDNGELLEELLQNKCLLKVKQADEKESILPGHVYIAPPDYHLLIENDKTLSLTTDIHVNYSRPSIDLLLESAAEAYHKNLIGIILTGSSSDGSQGLLRIKKSGGLTIAQKPSTAEYFFMPESAVRIGAATHVLTLEEIKLYLQSIYERRQHNHSDRR
jgi:two-component system chemotaxis response regulator CheB